MRVHRVYFRGGQYTDQVAAGAAAARLYAERLFPELGASVKTECMMLQVDGRRSSRRLLGRGLFNSEFSHSNTGRLTSHPEGHLGLWRDLGGKNLFPIEWLIPAGTLEEWVCGHC